MFDEDDTSVGSRDFSELATAIFLWRLVSLLFDLAEQCRPALLLSIPWDASKFLIAVRVLCILKTQVGMRVACNLY